VPDNKILVIRGGAIGDFILTFPVFHALKEHFPESKLEVLGYQRVMGLALAGGLVSGSRSIESQAFAAFFARNGKLDPQLCEYFDSFALIISFLYDPDLIFQTNIDRCSNAQFIQGPHRPDETQTTHATEVFLEPLKRLAIFGPAPEPKLHLEHNDAATRFFSGKPFIAVHPGSGSEMKNWPENRWREVINGFIKQGYCVLVVGGEAERPRVERLRQAIPVPELQVAHSLPLTEVAQLLKEASIFVGHDSGITHLAAAVGTPGLALWGPSKQSIWAPKSAQFKILRAPGGLLGITVQQVMEEANTSLRALPSRN
jgi:heptosyltransferase-2